MATVEEVIRAARDLNARFTRERHPNGVLLRHMGRYQRELSAKLADARPDLLRDQVAASGTAPTITLPAGALRPTGGEVRFGGTREAEPLHILGIKWTWRARPRWSAEQNDRTLTRLGDATLWSDVESWAVWYWPAPDALTALSSSIDLPGDPLGVMAAACADLMATRDPDMVNDSAALREREHDYINEVTGRKRVKVGRVKEVW